MGAERRESYRDQHTGRGFRPGSRYATCSVWEKKSSSISPSNVQSLRGRDGSGVLREEAGGCTWARLGSGGGAAEGAEEQHQGWGWHRQRGSPGAGTGPDTGSPRPQPLSPSSSPPLRAGLQPGLRNGEFFLRHLHPLPPGAAGGGLYLVFKRREGEKKNKN